jgi:hypothetical protein
MLVRAPNAGMVSIDRPLCNKGEEEKNKSGNETRHGDGVTRSKRERRAKE